MNESKKLDGVTCTVSTCTYNGHGNVCTARKIKVGTEYAVDKAETLCATFENKTF